MGRRGAAAGGVSVEADDDEDEDDESSGSGVRGAAARSGHGEDGEDTGCVDTSPTCATWAATSRSASCVTGSAMEQKVAKRDGRNTQKNDVSQSIKRMRKKRNMRRKGTHWSQQKTLGLNH